MPRERERERERERGKGRPREVAATAGVCLTLAPEDQQQGVAMEDEAGS
jgi:hypothetical protein